jgi:ATP-dependent DNA helicase RecG
MSPDLNNPLAWISGNPEPVLSVSALDHLRRMARDAGAPQRLLDPDDIELLRELGLLTSGGLAREALLLAGSEDGLNRYFPEYRWKYEYHWGAGRKPDCLEGNDPIPVALTRLLERMRSGASVLIMPPSSEAFEHRPYPELALMAALLNAFCHADYALGVPVQVRQEAARVEFVNPGSMPADISPDNVLRRRDARRNPLLIQALTRLGLANQAETGMQRMVRTLLGEGFQPPEYDLQENLVQVSFIGGGTVARFRLFVEKEIQEGRPMTLEILLLLHAALQQPEIDGEIAARVCQVDQQAAVALLDEMNRERGYLQRISSGQETVWALRREMYAVLYDERLLIRQRRWEWEKLKERVLHLLKQRAEEGDEGISNAEIRQVTRLKANRSLMFLYELMKEHPQIEHIDRGRLSVFRWRE